MKSNDELFQILMERAASQKYIHPEDIPGIELYMDQVTTFMGSRLRNSSRNPEEDKILTKTMINNYAKNHLLPSPEKKKYTKEHIMVLMFIYYFKNILSIGDIQSILNPLTERYFAAGKELDLEKIYEEVFSLEKGQIDQLKECLTNDYQRALGTFTEEAEADKDFLQLFSFICMLSYDIYIRKQIIEKIVDTLPKAEDKKTEK